MNKNSAIFAAMLIGLFLGMPHNALAVLAPSVPSTTDLGIYELIPTQDGSSYSVAEKCTDWDLKRYEELEQCRENCDECVLDDELCWSCKSVPVAEPELSWWGKLKNWVIGLFTSQPPPPTPSAQTSDQQAEEEPGFFKRIFNRIVDLFTSDDDQPVVQLREEPSEQVQGMEKFKNVGTSILGYHNGKAAGEESQIDQELQDAIAAAPDMAVMLKLRSLILIYCQDKHEGDTEGRIACIEGFMKEFRKRGDQLKEKLFDAIDPNDPSSETYLKIIRLRSILMAGTKASGEGEWFSTANIKKVMNGLKQKMQQWFQNALLNVRFEDLEGWYSVALAYTSASDSETGSRHGTGLMEGSNPLAQVQYRAHRLALQEMIKIDICKPDPAKLKRFQDMLAKTGCEKLLGNAKACEYIAKGNLEAAYANLYNQDKDDEANNHPQNKAPEPIDCSKQQTTETQTENPQEPIVRPSAEQTEASNDSEDHPVFIPEPTEDPNPVPSTEPSENPNEAVCTANPNEPTDTCDTEAPQPETPTSSNPVSPPQDITEPEPEPPPTDPTAPEIPPQPEPEPPASCVITFYQDPTIGWNFSVSGCDATYSQAFSQFINCGSQPPLVIAEQTELEVLCYETAGGFVDKNVMIPCYPLPIPGPDVAECVAMMLNNQSF